MKYYSRAGIYKASNVTFNPSTLEAFSYSWWKFSKRIGTKIVFNNYPYSNTTRRHQWKVKHLMAELGLTIDTSIEAPRGLDRLDMALDHYNVKLNCLRQAMLKPRIRQSTKDKIAVDIALCNSKIKEVKALAKVKQ